jgi:hypothetical protein
MHDAGFLHFSGVIANLGWIPGRGHATLSGELVYMAHHSS